MTHRAAITRDLEAIKGRGKWPVVVVRTIIGTLFVALGAWLIFAAIQALEQHGKLEMWLLGPGLVSIVLGASVWSTKLVAMPFRWLLATLRDVADIVRGRPPAPPPSEEG